ncbi:MAG: COX15/CtaA family protein, partial [Proteobacteria bacterium]|nr:COX15/CtaA family protein [Pseudomonadota bacterium]
AIHLTHRIGAVVATLAVLWAAWLAWRATTNERVRRGSIWISAALALQLLIAVLMILEAFPLWLATGHNAGAALLLLSLLVFNKRLRESATA